MRLISKLLERLEGLYAEVTPESIADYDRGNKVCKTLEGKDPELVKQFAVTLGQEIKKRYTHNQIIGGLL
jgi:hypothetical protein